MLKCWELEPELRPSFISLVNTLSHFLETMVDYMDIGAFASEKSPDCNSMSLAWPRDPKSNSSISKNDTFIELDVINENEAN